MNATDLGILDDPVCQIAARAIAGDIVSSAIQSLVIPLPSIALPIIVKVIGGGTNR